MNTQEKLDQLAEFQAQKDSIEAKKRALLDTVTVPAEVLAVQEEARKAALNAMQKWQK